MASVVIHLTAVVIANADKNTCPLHPKLMKQTQQTDYVYHPCMGQPISVLRNVPGGFERSATCRCGSMLFIKNPAIFRCPVCERECNGEQLPQSKSTDVQTNRRANARSVLLTATESVGDITPSAYRVWNILLHGCLLAGRSLDLITESDVNLFLSHYDSTTENQDNGSAVESLLTAKSMVTSTASVKSKLNNILAHSKEMEESYRTSPRVNKCEVSIINKLCDDWQLLRDLGFSRHEDVTLFLHTIIRAATDYLFPEQRLKSSVEGIEWEKSISVIIDQEVRAFPQRRSEYKRICLLAQGVHLNYLELQIDELDNKNSSKLRRMLRRRKSPSFTDFQARFCTLPADLRFTKYAFLQLFLYRHECIQYIRFLPILLMWNKHVMSTLSHKIKRREASQMRIADCLRDKRFHSDETAIDSASQAFEEFQHACHIIHKGWMVLTGKNPEFDSITNKSLVSKCIDDPKEPDNILRTMIQVLQETQNDFLRSTLTIASRESCPSLNCVVKGDNMAGLRTVPLTHSDGAIIEYEWQDTILEEFCDVDTEYGQGSNIRYNFSSIEKQLAERLILNKAFLSA